MLQSDLTRRKLSESRIVEELMVIHSKQFPSICPVLLFVFKNDVWMSMWRYVYMNVDAWGAQKVASGSLELEFQNAMSCWRWVLRLKLLSFSRVAHTFNPWAISPVPFSKFHIQESQSPSFELGPTLQTNLMF